MFIYMKFIFVRFIINNEYLLFICHKYAHFLVSFFHFCFLFKILFRTALFFVSDNGHIFKGGIHTLTNPTLHYMILLFLLQ